MNQGIEVPRFEEFATRHPTLHLDTQRLILEVLWDVDSAQQEYNSANLFAKSVAMWGRKAFMLRYKDPKTGNFFPVSYMSYDEDSEGNIHIHEIQGTRQGKVSYRVYSSFRVFDFFLKLVEENFTKKGKRVTIETAHYGMETIANVSNAAWRYEDFQKQLTRLNATIQ